MNLYKNYGKQIIRNEKIHQFYRSIDILSVNEMISIITSSYMSLESQLENLKRFLGCVSEEGAEAVNNMITLYEMMHQMIYNPKECYKNQSFYYNVCCERYNAYDIDEVTLENVFDNMGQEKIQCSTIEEVLLYVNTYKAPCYCFTVELVFDSGMVPFCFRMLYVNGVYEVMRCYFDVNIKRDLNCKDVIEVYENVFWRMNLPYKNGECVQFQLPFMKKPLQGVLFCEKDGNGCWYNFMYPTGVDNEAKIQGNKFIDMSYLRMALVTDYSVLDWLELIIL